MNEEFNNRCCGERMRVLASDGGFDRTCNLMKRTVVYWICSKCRKIKKEKIENE